MNSTIAFDVSQTTQKSPPDGHKTLNDQCLASSQCISKGSNDDGQQIIIQMCIDKDLLTCGVCLESIDIPLYQCSNGPHYLCSGCVGKVRKCEVCKTGKFLRNRLLEDQLRPFLINCTRMDCKQMILPWAADVHEEQCRQKVYPCFLCKMQVSKGGLQEHYERVCDCEYLDNQDESRKTVNGFNCKRRAYLLFKVPLTSGRSVCRRFENFFVLCKAALSTEQHPYWLVVVIDDSHPHDTATKRPCLATFELIDKTGVFPSSLSLTVEPWSDLQQICERYASLIQAVSGNLELKCTIEQDMSDCTSWISPISGEHHNDGAVDWFEATNLDEM